MNPSEEELELNWEQISEGGIKKRIGRSKTSNLIQIEIKLDEQGREIEKRRYHEDGELRTRIVYERDGEREPKMVLAYDKNGKLIWRHERGKRPEEFPND